MRRPVVRAAALAASAVLMLAGCGGSDGSGAASNVSTCDDIVKGASSGAARWAPEAGGEPGQLTTAALTAAAPRAVPAALPRAVPVAAPRAVPRRAAKAATTITFVAAIYTDNTQKYWTSLVDAFQKQNPDVTVKVQMIDWNNIGQQVNTMVSTKQYPDVLNIDSFSTYAANDLLYKADEVASQEVLADFIPTFAKDGVLKGAQYGLPFIGSTRAFFYNKDLLSKAGVTAPPTTWAELVDAAKKVKESGAIGYGLPLGAEDAHGEFSMWMWGNGGDWKTGEKFSINSAQNVETMTFLSCLANTYKVTEPHPGKTIRGDVFQQFSQGKIGMITGASFLPTLLKQWKSTVQYGVSTVPTRGQKPSTLGVQDYLMAFRKPGNQDAVSRFVNFFYQKDNYVRFLTEEGFLPTTLSGIEALKTNPDFAPFLELLKEARFYPQTDPAWTKVVGALKNQLGTAVEPGGDPKKVLDALQRTAEQG